ncbi:MAG TPA: NnrS family protein [Gemmataceae bacterium]|nr:NnrS family protein [Gemmataceae bacterium]
MFGGQTLNRQTMLPELLRTSPQVRPVLDRYGLRGCGGAEGPVESVGFFAHAHDVDADRLLRELQTAMAVPAANNAAKEEINDSRLADAIYRPFFKAGIVVVLTLGAVWGAYLLLRIGFTGSFTAVGLHEINAHGHAQIFGWVGLFVMGFAYQAFPRFKHTTLRQPRLAHASLWLMLAGLITRAVLEPLAGSMPALVPLAVAASALEVCAVGIFALVLFATWRGSGKPLAVYDYYVACALGWFVVQTLYDSIYLAATLMAADRQALLNLVAMWQGSLREIQIHGFALLMIVGVSQRIFPHFYGMATPSKNISIAALIVLNTALICEVTGLLLTRSAGHGWAILWYGGALLLAGAVFVLVRSWHIFARPEFPDRSLKFLRTAYAWLFISLGLLVLLPVYQRLLLPLLAPDSAAAQMGFSHAYYGAVRHAITVGFVSLMIMGVAAKVVPTLNGVDVHTLTRLWGPFLLVNIGCSLRVTGQILTDITETAFPITGVSGLLEVSGLAWWGGHLWLLMSGRLGGNQPPQAGALQSGQPIEASHRVGEILSLHPELLSIFLDFGFTPLKNPLARKFVAGRVTLAQACRFLDIAPAPLLAALNHILAPAASWRMQLPVVESCKGNTSDSPSLPRVPVS